jgi:hypothetical protein
MITIVIMPLCLHACIHACVHAGMHRSHTYRGLPMHVCVPWIHAIPWDSCMWVSMYVCRPCMYVHVVYVSMYVCCRCMWAHACEHVCMLSFSVSSCMWSCMYVVVVCELMHMSMCVCCRCLWAHAREHVCVLLLHVSSCMWACMHAVVVCELMHVSMYVCCLCVSSCMWACMHAVVCLYACMCTMHAFMHVGMQCIHVCTCAWMHVWAVMIRDAYLRKKTQPRRICTVSASRCISRLGHFEFVIRWTLLGRGWGQARADISFLLAWNADSIAKQLPRGRGCDGIAICCYCWSRQWWYIYIYHRRSLRRVPLIRKKWPILLS